MAAGRFRRSARQIFARAAALAARPTYGPGLRAAAATVLPLYLGDATGHPQFRWMALGGWLVTLADAGGSYPARAAAMAALTGSGALAIALGTLVGNQLWPALPALFLVAVGCSLLRVLGEGAGVVGLLALVAFCIGQGSPDPVLEHAAQRAGIFAAGGGLAMALSLGVWPIHPYRPAREALSAAYLSLAALAATMRALRTSAPGPEWDALARTRRNAVRVALERARDVLAGTRSTREGESGRGRSLLDLYQQADAILGELVALWGRRQHSPAAGSPAPAESPELLARVEDALTGLARAIHDPDRLDQSVKLSHDAAALLHGGDPSAALRALSPAEGPSGALSLRDALAPGSLQLRHALRLGATVTAAFWAATTLHLQRPHWVTITSVILLQPHPSATFTRGLQRLAGTAVGVLAAALLTPLLHGPLWVAALLFPLSVIAMALRPVNYGLFSALVTPVFLLMADNSGGGRWALAMVRVLDTLLGGAFALAGALLLWPDWERQRLPAQLAPLFRGLQRYLRALLLSERGHPDPAEVAAARRQLGLAGSNAEASFQRFLSEPHDPASVEAFMALLAWARRMAATLAALGVGPGEDRPAANGAALQEEAHALDAALDELATAAEQGRAPTARTGSVASDPSGTPVGLPLLAQLETPRAALEHLALPGRTKPLT